MSSIHFRKDAKKLLSAHLSKLPYHESYTNHVVILKKVYNKIHNILKSIYPDCLADLINSYVTDYMSFCMSPHVSKVYVESDNYDLSKTLVVSMRITGQNININLMKYNINFQFVYYIQVNSEPIYELTFKSFVRDSMNDYEKIGFKMSHYNVQLIPFFNYYLNYINFSKHDINIKLSRQIDSGLYLVDAIDPINKFSYHDDVISYVYSPKCKVKLRIINHRRFKNIIIMIIKLINEINKSLIKYQQDEQYEALVKINKPINMESYKYVGNDDDDDLGQYPIVKDELYDEYF